MCACRSIKTSAKIRTGRTVRRRQSSRMAADEREGANICEYVQYSIGKALPSSSRGQQIRRTLLLPLPNAWVGWADHLLPLSIFLLMCETPQISSGRLRTRSTSSPPNFPPLIISFLGKLLAQKLGGLYRPPSPRPSPLARPILLSDPIF